MPGAVGSRAAQGLKKPAPRSQLLVRRSLGPETATGGTRVNKSFALTGPPAHRIRGGAPLRQQEVIARLLRGCFGTYVHYPAAPGISNHLSTNAFGCCPAPPESP